MTQATKTPEAMLAQMTWLLCASCGGGLYIRESNEPGCCDMPCSSCQDSSGTATGLLMPGLSETCFCLDAEKTPCDGCLEHIQEHRFGHWHRSEWCACQGRNRIPRRHDVLDAVLEAILDMDWGIYEVSYSGISVGQFPHGCHIGEGDTLTEKAISALYAALVAKGLVGD